MVGYSGATLPKKLGIKPHHRVWLSKSPQGFARTLGGLPEGVRFLRRSGKNLDVILLFCGSRRDLVSRFTRATACLAPAGGLWVCWPKKASGVPTDLAEPFVREHGLSTGLVDNKICAVDETWSGLRFVIRVKDRKGR